MSNLVNEKYCPYKIIDEDGKRYFYNLDTNGIFELDDVCSEIINGTSNLDEESDEYKENIEFMKANFYYKNK